MTYGMGQCAGCSADQADPRIKLWDGKYYCVPCLEAAAEGLADYAEANPVFEETMPESVNRRLPGIPTIVRFVYWDRPFNKVAILCLIGFIFFGLGEMNTTSIVCISLLIVARIGSLSIVVWAKGPFRRRRFARGVRIENGIVSVLVDGKVTQQFPLDSARCLRSVEPIECVALVDTVEKDSLRQVFKRVALAGFTDHKRGLIEGLLKIKGIELQPAPLEIGPGL